MVYFVFLPFFWPQIKLSAITENRKQQLEKKKKRYAKRIFKWKVLSDNRMGNHGNHFFSDLDISFNGKSEEIRMKLKKGRKYIGKKVTS